MTNKYKNEIKFKLFVKKSKLIIDLNLTFHLSYSQKDNI